MVDVATDRPTRADTLIALTGAFSGQIQDREALLHKWTEAYVERLKHSLARGRYRFAKGDDTDWRTLAGVTARVIKYLRGDDWRHGA